MKPTLPTNYKSKFILSNELLNGVYFQLPVADGRVLKLLLKSLYKENIQAGVIYSVSVETFSKFTDIDIKESRRILETLGEQMRFLPAIKQELPDGTFYISWFSFCGYNRDLKEFQIKFHEDVLPYIEGLIGNFSQIPLGICSQFKSSRTIAIAEWLYANKYRKNKQNFSEMVVSVEEFCTLFKVPEKSQEYRILKRDILKPFVKSCMGTDVFLSMELKDSDTGCRGAEGVHTIKFLYVIG